MVLSIRRILRNKGSLSYPEHHLVMGSHQEKFVSAGAAGVVAVVEFSGGLVKVGEQPTAAVGYGSVRGYRVWCPMGALILFIRYSDEYSRQ